MDVARRFLFLQCWKSQSVGGIFSLLIRPTFNVSTITLFVNGAECGGKTGT